MWLRNERKALQASKNGLSATGGCKIVKVLNFKRFKF